MIELMQTHITAIVKKGQKEGNYRKMIADLTISTIIFCSMRMTVIKWKLSGHKSNLIKDGNTLLTGILKMIEK